MKLLYYIFISLIPVPALGIPDTTPDPSMTTEQIIPAGKSLQDTKRLIKEKLATIQREIELLNNEKWKVFERKEPVPQDIIDNINVLRTDQADLQDQLLAIDNVINYDNLYIPKS